MQKGHACRQAGFSGVIILIIALILASLAGAYFFGKSQVLKPQSQTTPVPSSITDASREPNGSAETANPNSIGANWKTYTNTDYSYQLEYPSTWKIEIPSNTSGKGYATAYINLISDTMFSIVKNGNTYLGPYAIGVSYDDGSTFNEFQQKYPYVKELIGNNTAYRFKSVPLQFENEYVFFPENSGRFISISITPYSTSQHYPNQDGPYQIFNQILSTFKFLP